MSAGWREEYLAGIQKAHSQHTVDNQLITAYSQLIDRISALEAENATLKESPRPASSTTTSPTPSAAAAGAAPESTARLRSDLAEALRAKGQFQSRLQTAEEELIRLRAKTAADAKVIRDLTADRRVLTIKLRDRDEELRGKNKIMADLQDEMVVLNMQLNLAEKQRSEKEAENKQLVERYMKRVGQEAEAMNRANEPLFSKKKR